MRLLDTIGGLRVRGERLGKGARFLLLLRLNLLEETDESLRIVARLVHILQSKIISFRFEITLELHESQRQSQAGSLIHSISDAASYENQRQRANLGPIRPCHLAHLVAGAHVGNLMRHDSGEFRLFVGCQDQPGIHIEKPARQGERVDFIGVNDLDSEGYLRIRIAHQILADAVHVFCNHRVGDHLHAVIDLH